MSFLKIDLALTGRDKIKRNLQVIKNDLLRFKRDAETQAAKATATPGLGTPKTRRKAIDQSLKGLADIGKAARRIEEKNFAEKIRNIKREERLRIRLEEKAARKARRELEKTQALNRRRIERGVKTVGGNVINTTGRIARGALGALTLGGALGFGAAARDQGRTEGAIADLVNQAKGAGDSRSRTQIAAETKGLVNTLATTKGISREEGVSALSRGVALTGNLKQFTDNMEFLADVSVSSGADLGDTAEAAGNVFNELGKTIKDTTERNKVFRKVMLQIQAGTEAGSIEMKDFAAGLAKVTSSAGQFSGNAGDMIATMATLAQLSRTGGAASSEEAVTSVQNVPTDILRKRKILEKKFKVQTTIEGGTKLRNPMEILLDLLQKTGGQLGPINDIFGEQAGKAVRPLQQAFVGASGGKTDKESLRKGREAAAEIVDRIKNAAKTEEELKEAVAFRLEQADKRLEIATQKVTVAFGEKLLPVLEAKLLPVIEGQLIPALVEAAPIISDWLGKIVEFASENPYEGIAAVIAIKVGADIAAAQIGSGIAKAAGLAVGAQGGLIGAAIAAAIGTAAIAYHLGKEGVEPFERGTDLALKFTDKLKKGELTPEQKEQALREAKAAREHLQQTDPGVFSTVGGGLSALAGGQTAGELKQGSIDHLTEVIGRLEASMGGVGDREAALAPLKDLQVKTQEKLIIALQENTKATLQNDGGSTKRTNAGPIKNRGQGQ